MKKKLSVKYFLLTVSISCQTLTQAQELNIGGEVGVLATLNNNNSGLLVKADIEYKPKFAYVAVNSNPGVLIGNSDKVVGIIPLNIKFVFGKNFRTVPTAGLFYLTSKTWGYSVGLTFEKILKEKYIPFFTCSFVGIRYLETSYSHGQGTISYYDAMMPGINLSCGFKYNFLSKKN